MYVRYADVEAALAARGYSLIRLLVGVTAGTGVVLAASWGRLKQWGAAEGADVATLTLADEQLQAVAAEVGRGVAGGVLADEGVRQAVREVLGQAVVELMRGTWRYRREMGGGGRCARLPVGERSPGRFSLLLWEGAPGGVEHGVVCSSTLHWYPACPSGVLSVRREHMLLLEEVSGFYRPPSNG